MSTPPDLYSNNFVLNGLGPDEMRRIAPALETVDLTHGSVLHGSGEPIEHIYFPIDAMISVVTVTAEGQTTEVGVIGREGLSGVEGILNTKNTAVNTQIIQLPGKLLRAPRNRIKKEFSIGGALQKATLEFTRAMLLQISQTALCNRLTRRTDASRSGC